MDPIALLSLSYKGVTVANALVQIRQRYDISTKVQHKLEDIHSTLQGVEKLLEVQIYQPLKSGLSMLTDAEAEYLFNIASARELAQSALLSFNQAEGQLADIDNQLLAVTGKACAYKLLGKIGAYNNAARRANELCETREKMLDDKAKMTIRTSLMIIRMSYPYLLGRSFTTFKQELSDGGFLES
jgi:hypothetical protein